MRENFELNLSYVVVVLMVAVYVVYETVSTPSGGHPFGHSLGIIGATLMLMTEILYSARKRWRFFNIGRLRHWLSFHIFTGIVGPTLVLMHTGLEFRGLAGLTMLLTVLVVASGFLGRYIYTAVPRTLAGIEVDRRTLEADAAEKRAALTAWAADKSDRVQELIATETRGSEVSGDEELPVLAIFTRRFEEWREKRQITAEIKKLDKEEQARLAEIEQMLEQQQRLMRQIKSLKTVRRLMGWWHTLHVPLGLTLFTAMFIHIFGSLFYSGL
jgi:hypothetical protein